MSKKILLSILVIVVAIGLVGVGTYALWSDSAASNGNLFATGTFDVSITSPSPLLPIVVDNMYPGSKGTYEFKVKNISTVPANAKLSMTGVWGGGLADHLKADVYFGTALVLDDAALASGTLPLGDLPKGAEEKVTIEITMDSAVTDHMSDAVIGDVTFTLNQY